MDKERWTKVREIFSHLSEQSPSFRSNYLDMVCEDNPDLRSQVEKMLLAHDEVDYHPAFSDAGTPAKLPESIGAYRVVSELGRGGMSAVYRAQHHEFGQVALKVLPKNLVSHPLAYARFKQEAALLEKINHPVVCRVFETDIAEGHAVIAMEEISGLTLEHCLQQHPFSFRDSIHIALEVADALTEAHRAGIIHRDIKPTNVLLADGIQPRLIDFGIAKFADTRLTATGDIMGSPAYMSPEQWRAEQVGPETDVWSLGILLFEILTGSTPFASGSVTATAQRVLNETAPSLPGKSMDGFSLDELQPLLTQMLEKKQSSRIRSMQAVSDLLKNIAR